MPTVATWCSFLCRTTEHFINEHELEQCIQNLKALKADGLVVLGGTNAVSDAAILTEYLLNSDSQTCVVGVPMTVDNGMPFIEAVSSLGLVFASACLSGHTIPMHACCAPVTLISVSVRQRQQLQVRRRDIHLYLIRHSCSKLGTQGSCT